MTWCKKHTFSHFCTYRHSEIVFKIYEAIEEVAKVPSPQQWKSGFLVSYLSFHIPFSECDTFHRAVPLWFSHKFVLARFVFPDLTRLRFFSWADDISQGLWTQGSRGIHSSLRVHTICKLSVRLKHLWVAGARKPFLILMLDRQELFSPSFVRLPLHCLDSGIHVKNIRRCLPQCH